jgi:uncharacterized membrane protein YbjE (DUF340 family)
MLIIIGIMLTGVLAGYLLRRRKFGVKHLITALIWLLLFLLGIEVGTNRAIIEGIGTIGVEALLLTAGAVVGSTLCAWFLWRWVVSRNNIRKV